LTVVHCVYRTYVCAAVIACVQQYIHVCGEHAPSSIFMAEADSISNRGRVDRSRHSQQQNMTSHCAAVCWTVITFIQLYLRICREHAPSIIFMSAVDSIGSARIDRSGHSQQQNTTSHSAALCQTTVIACIQLLTLHVCREHAPSIIFMDEVDSIGSIRSDSGGGGGGHSQHTTSLHCAAL